MKLQSALTSCRQASVRIVFGSSMQLRANRDPFERAWFAPTKLYALLAEPMQQNGHYSSLPQLGNSLTAPVCILGSLGHFNLISHRKLPRRQSDTPLILRYILAQSLLKYRITANLAAQSCWIRTCERFVIFFKMKEIGLQHHRSLFYFGLICELQLP